MSKPVTVAAVGLGWVSRHRHLPVMAASPAFRIVGAIDRHPGTAQDVARAQNLPRAAETGDLAAVPWLDAVEALVIGAAPMAHAALIGQALALGKHVLTEKPFTMTVAEGEALAAQARAAGLTLAVVHNFQFARSTRRLLADMAAGRLGAIRSVRALQLGNPRRRLPVWYQQLPMGLFFDESPHLFYLLRRVAGGPLRHLDTRVWPEAEGPTPRLLDAQLVADAPGGPVPVTVHCNFASPISEWYLQVFGEERVGMIDIFRDIYIDLPNDGRHDTLPVVRTSILATVQHWWQHLPSGIRHLRGNLHYGNEEVFARFAAAVRSGCPPADIDVEDALAVLRLQHAVIDNARVMTP